MRIVLAVILACGLLLGSSGQAMASSAPTAIKHFDRPPFELYKVSGGDTLYFIGKRYSVSVPALFQLNPGINAYSLQPGQIIRLKPAGNAGATNEVEHAQSTPSSFEQQVLNIVNEERAKAGLAPLRMDAALSNMARDKAIDMYTNKYFDHISPTYGSPFDMMTAYGISYSYAGENIARGQRSPEEVMDAWMNSPGHRANILNPNFNAIGIAYYKGDWVQAFIRS